MNGIRERFQYSKICAFIRNAIEQYISKDHVDVMFDIIDYVYIVKIENMFGEAEYRFTWSQVLTYGTSYILEIIKRDLVFPNECEE